MIFNLSPGNSFSISPQTTVISLITIVFFSPDTSHCLCHFKQRLLFQFSPYNNCFYFYPHICWFYFSIEKYNFCSIQINTFFYLFRKAAVLFYTREKGFLKVIFRQCSILFLTRMAVFISASNNGCTFISPQKTEVLICHDRFIKIWYEKWTIINDYFNLYHYVQAPIIQMYYN